MKAFVWFLIGAAAGYAVARRSHARSDRDGPLCARLKGTARDFRAAVSDGYRRREAELRAAIDGAADTVAGLS